MIPTSKKTNNIHHTSAHHLGESSWNSSHAGSPSSLDSVPSMSGSFGYPAPSPSSWASTRGLSYRDGPDCLPLAFAAVRHHLHAGVHDSPGGGEPGLTADRLGEGTDSSNGAKSAGIGNRMALDNGNAVGGQVVNVGANCTHAVFITCLHLAHDMVLRDVGQYAWTTPVFKDPTGSMLKIMRRYVAQISTKNSSIMCRTAPDPSRAVIQHHLQRARLAAGPDSYIALIYCGHGIQEPPTDAGELWCYNQSFDECLAEGSGPTEYTPILLFDILTWSGPSTCYIWDCSYSGRFIRAALGEAEEIDIQLRAAAGSNPSVAELHPAVYSSRQIHFAACGPGQVLPRVTGMPDDLFTACLTTPLRIALLFHNLQTFPLTSTDASNYVPKSASYMVALEDGMSPSLRSRLWSELCSILHTVAWQSLDGVQYQKLFRQGGSTDLISNAAAGFLLAQRVMATYHCHPESIPAIPACTSHALWTTWDLILDNFFQQLPVYLDEATSCGWEETLQLVSFQSDQLDSVLSSDSTVSLQQHYESSTVASINIPTSLARLPIVCHAALSSIFRPRGLTALESCLSGLDTSGLLCAIQGGALDVALHVLESCGQDETGTGSDGEGLDDCLVSIWASLVRHPVCVASLASPSKPGSKGSGAKTHASVGAAGIITSHGVGETGHEARPKPISRQPTIPFPGSTAIDHEDGDFSTLPAVKYFLSQLSKYLSRLGIAYGTAGDIEATVAGKNKLVGLICQASSVLASVARYNDAGERTHFGNQILAFAVTMLDSTQSLVQQWGGLLVARVCRSGVPRRNMGQRLGQAQANLMDRIQERLIILVNDNTVETRATSLYALAHWVHTPTPAATLPELKSRTDLAHRILGELKADASPIVRRQLCEFIHCAVKGGGRWTTLALWVHFLELGVQKVPTKSDRTCAAILHVKSSLQIIQPDNGDSLAQLVDLVTLYTAALDDPAMQVAEEVGQVVKRHLSALRPYISAACWPSIVNAALSSSSGTTNVSGGTVQSVPWRAELIDALCVGMVEFVDDWQQGTTLRGPSGQGAHGVLPRDLGVSRNDFFEASKLSLQLYLLSPAEPHNCTFTTKQKDPAESVGTSVLPDASIALNQRTWIMRHRVLEDSLVIAEQQVGLPWQWHIKDIVLPEPRSTITFHSFLNTVVMSDNSHNVMLWDWMSGQKLGSASLDLPANARLHSARFVNELHGHSVILAEISNGDIHVLSGPPTDPSRIKCISSFRGLDMSLYPCSVPRKIVTTWWRQTGHLGVGGAADVINIWDCPAERCVKVLRTDSTVRCSVLLTEPVSGNLIVAGLANGIVRLYDLRQAQSHAILSWQGDYSANRDIASGAIIRNGIALGESTTVTSASSNGMLNIHDLRKLTEPTSSVVAHKEGISSASFQPHSGLMSTLGKLNHSSGVGHNATSQWTLYRTNRSFISLVSGDMIDFGPEEEDVVQRAFEPYTVMHTLRPFMGIGYGRKLVLRGTGKGSGDDTDSGSYSFLHTQHDQ